MLSRQPLSSARAVIRPIFFPLCAGLLSVSCDGSKDLIAPDPTGMVTGQVTNSVTGYPVAGAQIRIGSIAVTTSANGRFEIKSVPTEATTLYCIAAGFKDFETTIIVPPRGLTYVVGLSRIEVFELGDFALFVPADVDEPRAVILALGGPDTRGFATGKPLGAPIAAVEASLQALGQEFRTLASSGFAVLGTSRASMPNGPDSDQLLLKTIETAAATSGHPELIKAPLLLYGLSGGGPQASGFAARNPASVAGLFLKVPVSVTSVTTGDALRVPTYMVLAEVDAFVNNASLTASFEGNRRAGALWALAREPGVIHHSLTPAQRQLTMNWMKTVLALRLPGAPGYAPLGRMEEGLGWFGNRATGEVESAEYLAWMGMLDDWKLESWLPTEATAREWKTFVATRPAVITAASQKSSAR